MQTAPYGSWRSPITADFVSTAMTGLGALSSNGEALFWLESRPNEGGRTTLLMDRDGARTELTPAPLNVRSRVHEYGGGAYLATRHCAYVVNFVDQNIYRVGFTGGAPEAITTTDAATRYADFAMDELRHTLIAVIERPGADEPENALVSIDLTTLTTRTLHSGHDFYAAPRVAPDSARLCFLSWDHPNMPWDGTQLHIGVFDTAGLLVDDTIIAGGAAESIVQPEWLSDARIVFASDQNGFWNLHSYDASGIYNVHPDAAEYAGPAWALGGRHFAILGSQHVVTQRNHNGAASLVIIDVEAGIASPVALDWHGYDALTVHNGRIACIASSFDRAASIISFDPTADDTTTIATSGALAIDAQWFSPAHAIEFPTRNGAVAYAYYYAPHNPDFGSTRAELPPLLVMSHGGPTAAAHPSLNFRIQYYTSRGWAVIDVNYGGSSGFGRAYRARLDGQWGIVDVHDCEDAAAHLVAQGHVDASRIAIRGGSAGGYTTLAALTFGTRFRAGASHYGIGDLEALARDTHKFESRYLERLIGPYPEARATYIERSPVHHVDQLTCPVIFFQGLDDRVVPPNQAEAMVDALRRKRLPVAYIPFAGEQHGFRRAENIKRALDGEYLFFARVFGFEPADTLAELAIENLPPNAVGVPA